METEFEQKTARFDLVNLVWDRLRPLDNLISFANRDYGANQVIDDFLPILEAVLGKSKADLEKLFDGIQRHAGRVKVYEVLCGEVLKMEEKHYYEGEVAKVSIESLP